jgi:hypothetical protein
VAHRPALDGLVNGGGHVRTLRSGIDEHRAALPEEQIEKRFLEVRAPRLPKNEEIGIVFVDPKGRRFRTRGSRDPRGWQRAALQLFNGGQLRVGRLGRQPRDEERARELAGHSRVSLAKTKHTGHTKKADADLREAARRLDNYAAAAAV